MIVGEFVGHDAGEHEFEGGARVACGGGLTGYIQERSFETRATNVAELAGSRDRAKTTRGRTQSDASRQAEWRADASVAAGTA